MTKQQKGLKHKARMLLFVLEHPGCTKSEVVEHCYRRRNARNSPGCFQVVAHAITNNWLRCITKPSRCELFVHDSILSSDEEMMELTATKLRGE